jgi:hypothetical protein
LILIVQYFIPIRLPSLLSIDEQQVPQVNATHLSSSPEAKTAAPFFSSTFALRYSRSLQPDLTAPPFAQMTQ